MDVRFVAWAGYELKTCEAGGQIDSCPPTPSTEYIKDSPQMQPPSVTGDSPQIQTPRVLYEQRALPYQRDCD